MMEVLPISKQDLQINEQIRDKVLRVIDSVGTQLGIMALRQAMEIAEKKNLDLVKIAPQANPPVCKIIDYGKFRFEQAKREKEARKNQRVVEIKEVRLSLNIDTHDFETKKNHALRCISEGNKVKAASRFRGREMGHPELGLEIMRRFADAMSEVANVEKPAKEIAQNCLERGLLVLTAHEKVRIVPPLNITKTEMDEGLTILREVLAQ